VTQSYTQLLHHHSQIRKRVNWPVNFNGFRVLASLLYWCRSRDVNQTLHDVWPSLGLVRYVYVSRGSCLLTEFFKMQNSLCVQVLRTARHSTSRRQPNFVAWYKEWNYGTFTESATYTRQGGHHIGHRPTRNTIQRRRSGMSDVISHAYALVKNKSTLLYFIFRARASWW